MRGRNLRTLAAGLVLTLIGMSAVAAMAEEVSRISREDLKAILGDPDLVILDVRLGGNWGESERTITDAIRENPKEFESWADKYSKDKTIVLYCA
jgi:rhodanese-related sulfurtransferase